MKWIYSATAVAALGAILWGVRDEPAVRRWLPTALAATPSLGAGPTVAAGSVRKCRRGDEVLYTNGPCPGGSRELSVAAGTLTVVPAVAVPAAAAASGPRSVLRALADHGPNDLQQRRIDALSETTR